MIGELFLADFARFPAQFLCKLRAYIFQKPAGNFSRTRLSPFCLKNIDPTQRGQTFNQHPEWES